MLQRNKLDKGKRWNNGNHLTNIPDYLIFQSLMGAKLSKRRECVGEKGIHIKTFHASFFTTNKNE